MNEPSDREVYLVFLETVHGKRYWRVMSDPVLADPVERKHVLGPATVGPSGYANETEAAVAIVGEHPDLEIYHDPRLGWQFWQDCAERERQL